MATRILDIPLSTSPGTLDEHLGQSLASTSASYLTAPQPSSSPHSRSASSSTHTLGGARDSEHINPLHAIAFPSGKRTLSTHSLPQEVHIVKVTDDRVHIRSGPVPEPLLCKVGASIVRAVPDCISDAASAISDGAGPPPPSPPASTEHEHYHEHEIETEHESEASANPSPFPNSTSPSPKPPYSQPSANGRPVTFEDPTAVASGSSQRQHAKSPSRPSHTHSLSHRSSAETKSSFTTGRTNRITRTLTNPSDGGPDVEDDGLLHAPPMKYARRNTIGGSPPLSPPSSARPGQPRLPTMHGMQPPEVDGDLGELATDIQQQAEQIRRERLSKRAKAAQEAEEVRAKHDTEKALTRTASLVRAFSKEDNPLVGNLIGEGHVNYVLMYNMLTGIRIAVSRWQAKVPRELTTEDFSAAHKYSFDMCVLVLRLR